MFLWKDKGSGWSPLPFLFYGRDFTAKAQRTQRNCIFFFVLLVPWR
jgi:hypothetical protein